MKNKYKLLSLFLFIFIMFGMQSCSDEPDDEVLPIFGVYESHIVGLAGPFSMNVSSIGRDDILIDAPFDGDVWSLVEADIDNANEHKWDIHIFRQTLAPGIEILGDGFYFSGTIQLDYTISYWGEKYSFKLIGKY